MVSFEAFKTEVAMLQLLSPIRSDMWITSYSADNFHFFLDFLNTTAQHGGRM